MAKKIKKNPNKRLVSDIRKSKANYDFDVYSDVWRLDANISINLALLKKLDLSKNFENAFRLVLADYAYEQSAHSVRGIFNHFREFAAHDVTNEIDESHILNYKATLNDKTEHKLGAIRGFILDWHYKGYKGVSKKAAKLIRKLKLKGSEKGKAVTTGCPFSGAYSYDEQVDLIMWYVEAYTKKQISLLEYTFITALQYTGARTIQLTHLYNQDLEKTLIDGIEVASLNLPNAKKLGQTFRSSSRKRDAIADDLMLLLNQQAQESIRYVELSFNKKLSDLEKQTIPIFINKREIDKIDSYQKFLDIQKNTPDLLVITSSQIVQSISRLSHKCPLKTKRIKTEDGYGDLHINPRRFRYTHGTNLAMQGLSKYIIAYELGHEDTQNVGIYTEFNEEVAEIVEDAITPSLVPLAQAFSGTLIDSEKDAIRVNDPRSRIGNAESKPVGNCGNFGFCANGTIHCYTCSKFQPWVNAPHEKVLMQVEAERNHKQSLGASEFVLQGYNRSIDAIKVVIIQCEERKIELAKEEAINV